MITLIVLLVTGFWMLMFVLNAVCHPIKTVKKICGFVGFIVLVLLGLSFL